MQPITLDSSTWWQKVKDIAKIATQGSVIPDVKDGSTTAPSPEA